MTSIRNRIRPGTGSRRASAAVLFCVLATLSCSMFRKVAPQNQWSDRWGPMVPHTTFPGDCSLCHYPDRWDLLKEDFAFDHATETGYPLLGGHADAACLRCHNDRGPVQAYLARGCGGCHEDPHRSSLGLDCTRCHDVYTWQAIGLVLEHNQTRFPLVASHALAPCESCHVGATVGDFRGAPVDCHLCHQREALLAQPNHVVNGWIVNCQDCHDVGSWISVNFNHSVFPLVGGHAGVDCNRCHVGGRIQGTPTDCYSCHKNDYLGAPNHVAGNFSTDCTRCHNTNAWK